MANTLKGQATKQHILETAKNLFHQKGYDQTSIKNIVESAYVAKGTLYLYFEDKLDIMVHLVEVFILRYKEILDGILKGLEETSLISEQLIEQGVDDLFTLSISYKCCFIFFHNPKTAKYLRDLNYLEAFDRMNSQAIKEMILIGISKGYFRQVNSELYADIIYQMTHNFIEKTILNDKDDPYLVLAKKELAICIYRILTK